MITKVELISPFLNYSLIIFCFPDHQSYEQDQETVPKTMFEKIYFLENTIERYEIIS